MLVGIYRCKDPNGNYLPRCQAYEAILEHNGIPFERMEAAQPGFWERVRDLDLFILRWAHYDSDRQRAMDLLPVIENTLGVKCFPNMATCRHYDDKVKQCLFLSALGLPIVESYIFWERDKALEWLESAQFPLVFKLRRGAGSTNVMLVKTPDEARRLVHRMFGRGIRSDSLFNPGGLRRQHFNVRKELGRIVHGWRRRRQGLDPSPFWQKQKNYVLFQKFLPGNESDTRVTVIGDRAFFYRRMVRGHDFRASGSGMIDYDISKIDLRCVEIAHRVSREMKFQSMAYDFIFDEDNEPWFCEISYTFLPNLVQQCPGYWDAELNWHEGHFWPEHLHLIDALNLPDLKAPELDYC